MQSLWKDEEAKQFKGDLGQRVYTSRLLGRDKSLVLHGGGNTSVKIKEKNLFGEEETILHGLMPQKFVDHTHADAVLSVTNTRDGEKRIREIYGTRCVVIPYLIPGFDLARFCAKEFRARGTKDTVGMVLLNHGIFSFGETARESYERMIELVTLAEKYLES